MLVLLLAFLPRASAVSAHAATPHLEGQYEEHEAEYEALFAEHMARFEALTCAEIAPHWVDDTHFWFVTGHAGQRTAYWVDAVRGERREIFDSVRLRRVLEPLVGDLGNEAGLPFDAFDLLENGRVARFELSGHVFLLSLDDYTVREEPAAQTRLRDLATPRFLRQSQRAPYPRVYEQPSPDRRWLVGESGPNLSLRPRTEGQGRPLTADGTDLFAWDVQTARWAPNSRWLAVTKVDETGVHRVPVVRWLDVHEKVDLIPMPKAGGLLPRREVHFFDIHSGRRLEVQLGDTRNFHIFPLQWSQDSSEFFLLRVDRPYRRLELLAAHTATGAVRTVLEETADTFIGALRLITELQHRMFFPLADGKRFLWLSERDGWYHIYLYSLDGRLLRQLTHGQLPVQKVEAIDERTGWVYFLGSDDAARPYDQHLLRVRLSGGDRQRLTKATGAHQVSLAPSLRYFVDTHSTVARPSRSELRQVDGHVVLELTRSDIRPLKDAGWQPPEEFRVLAADGETELFGVLLKPYPFDPARKYPVIDYIYNGPFSTWVPRTFNDHRLHNTQALAQLGFVIFLVDGRGTPGRGKAFQDVVYRNFGRHEIPDHVASLRQLAADRSYIDLDRVGIYGGSWGGYMTLRALLLQPDVFHVGVATNSLVDLYDHEATGIEGYMGLVEENRQGYEYGSNLRLADQLRGHLLLIHSTSDVNVTLSTTMKMVEALIRAGRHFNLQLLPEQTHIPEGVSREFWLRAHRRYFVDHLQPPFRGAGSP